MKLGVSDYLLKPLKDGDLEQAVTRIIDQLEEGDRLRQKEEEETPIFRFNADRKAKNKYVEQAIKQIREHYKEEYQYQYSGRAAADQRRLFKPCVQKRDRLYIYHLSFLLPHESGNGTVKRGKFKGI